MKRLLLNAGSSILARLFKVAVLEGVSGDSVEQLIHNLRPRWSPDELIRIGGDRDGGYLVPADINTYDFLVSPGVGQSYDFDKYFIDRQIDSVLIDPTVELPSVAHLIHLKSYLGGYSSERDGTISLESILERYGSGKSRAILQMDIEGAEYGVIASALDSTISAFGMIVIEFHHVSGLCYRGMYPIIANAFNRLLKYHFVAHIHVNNSARVVPYRGLYIPETMEFTFVNREQYALNDAPKFKSPHRLDISCIDGVPDVAVPKCWW